jgi:hypothetical protein
MMISYFNIFTTDHITFMFNGLKVLGRVASAGSISSCEQVIF